MASRRALLSLRQSRLAWGERLFRVDVRFARSVRRTFRGSLETYGGGSSLSTGSTSSSDDKSSSSRGVLEPSSPSERPSLSSDELSLGAASPWAAFSSKPRPASDSLLNWVVIVSGCDSALVSGGGRSSASSLEGGGTVSSPWGVLLGISVTTPGSKRSYNRLTASCLPCSWWSCRRRWCY